MRIIEENKKLAEVELLPFFFTVFCTWNVDLSWCQSTYGWLKAKKEADKEERKEYYKYDPWRDHQSVCDRGALRHLCSSHCQQSVRLNRAMQSFTRQVRQLSSCSQMRVLEWLAFTPRSGFGYSSCIYMICISCTSMCFICTTQIERIWVIQKVVYVIVSPLSCLPEAYELMGIEGQNLQHTSISQDLRNIESFQSAGLDWAFHWWTEHGPGNWPESGWQSTHHQHRDELLETLWLSNWIRKFGHASVTEALLSYSFIWKKF